jgi:hypothetical protein
VAKGSIDNEEMRKFNLNSKIKKYIKYCSKLDDQEIEMILKIPFGLYGKRLQFKEVKKFIKINHLKDRFMGYGYGSQQNRYYNQEIIIIFLRIWVHR